ncbi:MAG TPA: FAD-dependent monooxygenase [Cyclobacteriaceae bacterium]|jgi:2-polyprenyl-6-methoxyphenol hydroxylase-like FAD-dependent oxidoreductase
MKKLKTDVLIVGAGPTGLMAANQLQRFGIDFMIIDKKSGPTMESRAIAVTARSLEIYEQMGLSDTAIQEGQRIEIFNLYVKGKPRVSVKIGEIGKGLSDFSYMLAFEQSKNEVLLSRNLYNHGKSIHWNYEFVEIKENQDNVTVLARNPDIEVEITALYLIACDGAGSPIRQHLNFSFRGGTYKHKFFVADAILKWSIPYDQLIISPGTENFCAFLPLQGNHTYRIIGTLPKSYFNTETVTFHDIREVVIRTLGIEIEFEQVNWFSTYKLHHRGVNKFDNNRVFLAGDAAHIHSPAGGQGMNTGLQDAYNLCWKLALVLKGQAFESLLKTYNEERLPFAKWLLRFTDRGFNMMTNRNFFIRKFRELIAINLVKWVPRVGFIRPVIFKVLSQIWYSYHGFSLAQSSTRQNLKFVSGDRLPYFPGEKFYSLFKNPSFHLLCLTNTSISDIQKQNLQDSFPFHIKIIEQKINEMWNKLGVVSELYIVVRPDNYILFIADSIHKNILEHYFKDFPKC